MVPFNRRTAVLTAVLVLIGSFSGAQAARSETSQDVTGVHNFGRVTDMLYRGAQPSPAGFAALHHMGVTIIVNFRNDDEAAREKGEVEALGMKYVAIPWSGRDEPNNAQIVQFLDLVRDNPQAKIFVHCQRGADRTGTMVAAYRIAVERKKTDEAVAEMHHYHYAHFLLPQLERYVDSLPQLLLSSSQFAAYAPGADRPAASPAVGSVAAAIFSPVAGMAAAAH